jgi:hypothetical protein
VCPFHIWNARFPKVNMKGLKIRSHDVVRCRSIWESRLNCCNDSIRMVLAQEPNPLYILGRILQQMATPDEQ